MGPFFIWGHAPKLEMLPAEKEKQVEKVVSIVRQLKENQLVIYFNDKPFSYWTFPELIAEINNCFTINIGEIYNALHTEIIEIQKRRYDEISAIENILKNKGNG